jgi:hypothetical protein
MRTISASPKPDLRRLHHIQRMRSALTIFWWNLNGLAADTYVGAASLIGFEALALVLGFTTAWPIAIPIVVAILALLFYARRFFRSIFQPRRVRPTIDDHVPDGPQD